MQQRISLPLLAVAATAALTVSACSGSGDPLAADTAPTASTESIVIGSADFPESQLLATIYQQALIAQGIEASTKLNIGSREVYIPALLDGSIDLLPEYTGATLSYLTDGSAEVTAPDEVAAALDAALPNGVSMLTPSEAQDSDALVVTQETAAQYNLTTIADLVPHMSELVLGGPPEWKTRHEGVRGLNEVYGLEFAEFIALDAGGPLTIAALKGGQVDVADMFSTHPAIEQEAFVSLVDNLNLFPAQNIVPIIATDRKNDTIVAILDAVSAALTTEDLMKMNARLGEQERIDDVAADWLTENGLR